MTGSQPCSGNHRHFHREGDEEAQHQQIFHTVGHRRVQQLFIVEGPDAGRLYAHKDQRRWQSASPDHFALGVDEEPGRRRDTRFPVRSFVAPQRDQEVHAPASFPQKKKNRNMSMARNTPITPPKIHIRFRWKKPDIFRFRQSKAPPERRAGRSAPPLRQRQSVERQMDRDAKNADPRQDKFRLPLREYRRIASVKAAAPATTIADRKRQRQPHGNQRYSARQPSRQSVRSASTESRRDKGINTAVQ